MVHRMKYTLDVVKETNFNTNLLIIATDNVIVLSVKTINETMPGLIFVDEKL